jgi:hypothetical protein
LTDAETFKGRRALWSGGVAFLFAQGEILGAIKHQAQEIIFAQFICIIALLACALRGFDADIFDAARSRGAVIPSWLGGILVEAIFADLLSFWSDWFADTAAVVHGMADALSIFAIGINRGLGGVGIFLGIAFFPAKCGIFISDT